MAEENKTISLKELKIKTKVETVKRKVKEAGKAAWNWINNNKELAATIAVAGTTMVSKGAKMYVAHKESERRDCSFYDPRKGRYTIARRKPTAREEAEIDRRYTAGESYAHILDDMRLAK